MSMDGGPLLYLHTALLYIVSFICILKKYFSFLFPKSDFLFSCHCQHVCLITGTSKCFSQIHWRCVYVALMLNCGWVMSVWLWINWLTEASLAYFTSIFKLHVLLYWYEGLKSWPQYCKRETTSLFDHLCPRQSQTNTEFLRLILIIK